MHSLSKELAEPQNLKNESTTMRYILIIHPLINHQMMIGMIIGMVTDVMLVNEINVDHIYIRDVQLNVENDRI